MVRGSFASVLYIALLGASAVIQAADNPEMAARCSAYFFMAANAKGIDEFNTYYAAGEYAYNQAVVSSGEPSALQQFQLASGEINQLIDRNWLAFDKADDHFGVICADLLRDANNPDKVSASPKAR